MRGLTPERAAELRLECLKLAVNAMLPDPVTTARQFAAFVGGETPSSIADALEVLARALREGGIDAS